MIENEPELLEVYCPEIQQTIRKGDTVEIYKRIHKNIQIYVCDYNDPSISCQYTCGARAYIMGEGEQRTSSGGHCLNVKVEYLKILSRCGVQINKVTEI